MTAAVEDKSQTEWEKRLENNRIKYGKRTEEIRPPENELKYVLWKILNRLRIKSAGTRRMIFINLQHFRVFVYLNEVLFRPPNEYVVELSIG